MSDRGAADAHAAAVLRGARTVLLIDWPSREVPDSLARTGIEVVSDDGPNAGYNAYQPDDDDVRVVPVSHAPSQADLVYTHRPLDELPDIIERALALGARVLWYQSGLDASGNLDPRGCWVRMDEVARARHIVESAGLAFVSEPYIGDVARQAQRD